jgi:8-oxo-dGTP pyrophosphatase MutT (NUDIX family)
MSHRLTELRALLESHPPLDDTEAGHRERMLSLVDAGERGTVDPFARFTFAPGHFTASSFVLSPDLNAVLLILHAKLGFWMQPGGHVDPGDPDVLAAAQREVAEETGLEALELWPPGSAAAFLDLDIHPIPARKSEPAHEHFDLRFLFRSPRATISDSDEVHGAQWVPLGAFERVRSDASVMRAVSRIRRLVGQRRA